MQTPMISVIVPVYNVGTFLPKCVDSLLAQTYRNIEIILVNDGSKDDSGAICDHYAQQDSRVKVLHKSNGGVSSARNLGLDWMQGEYCAFVDSDDHVHPCLIQRLMDACRGTDAQLAVCDWRIVQPEETISYGAVPNGVVRTVEIEKAFRYTDSYAHSCVYSALFAAPLVRDVRFDSDLYIGEDALFFARVLKQVKKLAYVPEALYYYVVYAQSAIHGAYTLKRQTEIEAWKRIGDLFSDYPASFQRDCKTKLATAYFAGLRCMLEGENTSTATPKQYLIEVRKLKQYVLHSDLPKQYKLGYALMCLCPNAYMLVFRRMKK